MKKKSTSRKTTLFIYGLLLFVGYMLADISILAYQAELPVEKKVALKKSLQKTKTKLLSDYQSIEAQNIFNADKVIPPSLAQNDLDKKKTNNEQEAVLSQLPLTLLGTIVHANKNKSIATIFLRSQSKAAPYSVGSQISSLATVTKIERRKVFFQNLGNGQNEYIQIKKDRKLNLGFRAPQRKSSVSLDTGIQKKDNVVIVKRELFDKLTSDLPALLDQAQVRPRNGPDGKLLGFQFVWIKPRGVYEKLGFKALDTLTAVNGKKVTSPQEGLKLFNSFKRSGGSVNISVERSGQTKNIEYKLEE